MIAPDLTKMRGDVLRRIIATEGGRYITPEMNRQPDPALRIASIHVRGLVGIGATEAQAQADWFRQAAAQEVAGAAAAKVAA